MVYEEARISNLHYVHTWRMFAERAKHGECREENGVQLAWSMIQTPFFNSALLTEPPVSEAAFAATIETARKFAESRQLPWLFSICQDYIPEDLRPEKEQFLTTHGLKVSAVFTGMLAEELAEPVHPLPTDVEFRDFSDERARYDNALVNLSCYGMPEQWAREIVDTNTACTSDDFGCTGYVDGKAVTGAVAMPIDGWLYVAMVATSDGYRKRGYAEAAMRYCLDAASKATGIRRTALHATEAGFPLYQQMGYRGVTKFLGCVPT